MQNLQTFIDLLSKRRNLHISVRDLTGILNSPLTKLEYRNVIHSKDFCSIAKSTDSGYRACMRCKLLSNTKAVEQKTSFAGHCIYGLFEAAVPLITDGAVGAIVYIGNAICDREYSIAQIKNTCRHTAADENKLIEQLDHCERIDDVSELYKIGEIICDYIKLLCETEPPIRTRYHWLTEAMLTHIRAAYTTPLKLRELALLYNKSEKYMGRLFKRETGMSFHEYCLSLQLEKAEALLLTTNEKVIDISLECGFNTVSYFNRMFAKKHAMSPTQYRQRNG